MGVHPDQPPSASGLEVLVAGRGDAGTAARHQLDARVDGDPGANDLGRPVCRAVVHHDDLQMSGGLTDDGVECGPDGPLLVARRDEHCEQVVPGVVVGLLGGLHSRWACHSLPLAADDFGCVGDGVVCPDAATQLTTSSATATYTVAPLGKTAKAKATYLPDRELLKARARVTFADGSDVPGR